MLEVFAFDGLVVSEYVLKDLKRALTIKLAVPPEIARGFLWLLLQGAVVVTEGEAPPLNLEDKSDIPELAAAIGGKADVLVTGDGELQRLGQVGGLQIVSPRGFWEKLRTQLRAERPE